MVIEELVDDESTQCIVVWVGCSQGPNGGTIRIQFPMNTTLGDKEWEASASNVDSLV